MLPFPRALFSGPLRAASYPELWLPAVSAQLQRAFRVLLAVALTVRRPCAVSPLLELCVLRPSSCAVPLSSVFAPLASFPRRPWLQLLRLPFRLRVWPSPLPLLVSGRTFCSFSSLRHGLSWPLSPRQV